MHRTSPQSIQLPQDSSCCREVKLAPLEVVPQEQLSASFMVIVEELNAW
jgi:hypothetical protein